MNDEDKGQDARKEAMPNTVQAIRERNTFEYKIEGTVFVLRRFSNMMSLQLHGNRAFGLMAEAHDRDARQRTLETMSGTDRLDMMRDVLELAMVSPRLGDVTEDGADIISFEDLSDDVLGVFAAVMGSGGDVENFTE